MMNLTLWQVDSLVQECTDIINLVLSTVWFSGGFWVTVVAPSKKPFSSLACSFSQSVPEQLLSLSSSPFCSSKAHIILKVKARFLCCPDQLRAFAVLAAGGHLHCSGNWSQPAVGSKLALIQVHTAGPWGLSSPRGIYLWASCLCCSAVSSHCSVSPLRFLLLLLPTPAPSC